MFAKGHIIPTEPEAYMCGTVQTSSFLVQKQKTSMIKSSAWTPQLLAKTVLK